MHELRETDGFRGGGAAAPPADGDGINGAFDEAASLRRRAEAPGAPAAEAAGEEAELLDAFEAEEGKAGLAGDRGGAAVRASRFIGRLKDARLALDRASSLGGELSGSIRHVGSRTFYRHGSGWVQAEVYDLTGEPTLVKITAYAPEYFTLLDAHPEVARILAIGDSVCFLLDGTVYLISG
jgi:hypothetical protein